MSYTAVMASKSEIMLFNKDVTAQGLKLTSAEFDTVFDIIHAGLEAQILNYMNRPTLTAMILNETAYIIMKNQCKLATIQVASNFFIWLKQESQGRVIQVNEGIAFLQDSRIFTKQIQEMLDAFRIPGAGAVTPPEEEDTLDDLGTEEVETEEIVFQWP